MGFFGISLMKGDEKFYRQIVMPTVHRLFDAENAHLLAIKLAKYGIVPPFFGQNKPDDEILVCLFCLFSRFLKLIFRF